jgi:hypothetical protein
MRTRLLRVLFLLVFAVMFAAYAVSIASNAPPDGLHDSLQIVGEQWC